jgi:hypothetical protein
MTTLRHIERINRREAVVNRIGVRAGERRGGKGEWRVRRDDSSQAPVPHIVIDFFSPQKSTSKQKHKTKQN